MSMDVEGIGWAVAGILLAASGIGLCVRCHAYASGLVFSAAGLLLGIVHLVPAEVSDLVAVVAMVALSSAIAVYPSVNVDVARALTLGAVLIGAPLLAWQLRGGGGLDPGDVGWVAFALVAVSASHVWWRLETTDAHTRSSLLWVLSTTGVTVFLVGVVALARAPAALTAVANAGLGLIGIAALLGAERARPLDGRWLASRAAAWFFSLACVFAIATLVLSLLTWRSGTSPGILAMALAAAICGTLWSPLVEVVQRVSDGVLFGYRPDALTAAQQVAVGIGDDPTAAVKAIQQGLVLPYAALALVGEDPVEAGDPTPQRRIFPIDAGAENVGELVVGLRPGDIGLSRDDERVITLSLPLLVQVIKARSLVASLQRERMASATAREEERRRLRRDLHDELGPRLTGIAFTADAAKLAMPHETTAPMLDRIRSEAEAALDEIRELVYGLRPPALDELGLAGAIRLKSASLQGPAIAVDAGALPALPAVVEVAAYRIVMEALTNVVRHSDATQVVVTIRVREGCATLTVADDGHAARDWTPGVGLTSMRKRAAELGGSVTHRSTPTGSLVTATLPLRTTPTGSHSERDEVWSE
jgi:signal transduction histidine kinase